MRGVFGQRQGILPVLLTERLEFPELDDQARELGPPGLVALGGDLSVARLLLAYRSGIFPWSVDPITWWSPHQRGIIEFSQFHVGQTLRRVLKQKPFEITMNHAFRDVVQNCALARLQGNWISPHFVEAYTALHEAGSAHSVECWQEGRLVGGIYGVATGGTFAAESMFYRVSNASKVALVHLVEFLQQRGFILFDIQMVTPTTAAFGGSEISRKEYLARLQETISLPVSFEGNRAKNDKS
ncbi:MAG TPA: leucyl/phenylalanyl-tRNA--protein transferase [Verrucomicrobiae bacterium]